MNPARSDLPKNWRCFALSLSLLMSTGVPAWAAVEGNAVEGQEAEAAPAFAPTHSATFKQLGRSYPMTLRGVEGSDSVSFDVRADQVVTAARLNLEYSYSPALIPELSQINVLVNEQVAASLPVPKENAGTPQQQVVELPPHLITEFNRLSLQLIGHYTMQCEDPLHSSLWAKVNNGSRLDIQATTIALPDDLSILPLPFFDPRDARKLELPFVFAASPDDRTLEGAAAVASWFGALASYRGAKFPVRVGQLPDKGSAVVLLAGTTTLAGNELGEQDQGPTLSVQGNPNDPYGKLLVISGRDGEQVRQAALALVSGSQAMAGPRATIDRLDELRPRQPYDAPNWLPSDRPVQLGELIDIKRLSVSGYDPGSIGIPMRLPPDLFDWRADGVPVHLRYRYTPQPQSTNSSLLISIGDKFVKSLPLLSLERLKDEQGLLARLQSDDTLLREVDLQLPLSSFPLQTDLRLRFMYDYIKQGECRDIIIDNMRGTIEPDSTIDLSGYEHFIAMPNLGVFQSSGFPFTRMADLSETAVVVSNGASSAELSAFLEVLGHLGNSTGLPATAVKVTRGDVRDELRGKDLLVLAAGANQPLLQEWAERLPASLDGSPRFELSDLVHRVREWVGSDERANVRKARNNIGLGSGAAGVYLAGFESPLDSGRSVVVIAAGHSDKLADATAALQGGEGFDGDIQGSLSVVNGMRIASLVADEQYFVGSLGPFRYLQWLLSRHFGLLLLLTALGVGLITLLLYFSLRARARARLKSEPL